MHSDSSFAVYMLEQMQGKLDVFCICRTVVLNYRGKGGAELQVCAALHHIVVLTCTVQMLKWLRLHLLLPLVGSAALNIRFGLSLVNCVLVTFGHLLTT